MSRKSFERTGGDMGVEVRRDSLAAAHMEVGAVMVSLRGEGVGSSPLPHRLPP